MSRRASSAARSLSPVRHLLNFEEGSALNTTLYNSPARQRGAKRHTSGNHLSPNRTKSFDNDINNGINGMNDSSMNMESSNYHHHHHNNHKTIPDSGGGGGKQRRKTSFQGTSYWVIFLTAATLHISVMITNYVVFDILGGKRDIQFASLLWGIMNTAIACMNLSALRSCAIPVLAHCTRTTAEATRMLFDETLVQPMSRLWIGLVVGVCFTYAATGFNLPPWTQLRFSATSYTVSVAWSFSLLTTFQQLASGD